MRSAAARTTRTLAMTVYYSGMTTPALVLFLLYCCDNNNAASSTVAALQQQPVPWLSSSAPPTTRESSNDNTKMSRRSAVLSTMVLPFLVLPANNHAKAVVVSQAEAESSPPNKRNTRQRSSSGSTSDELRRIYDEGASAYESLYSDSLVSRALDFPSLRRNLLSNAVGDVLELGVGTGLNLPHYCCCGNNAGTITSYTAIDISPKMMEQAKEKFVNNNGGGGVAKPLDDLYRRNKVEFRIGDATDLSAVFGGGGDGNPPRTFDTIVDTFGLCVFPDPVRVLAEARKLLKPSTGKILLLEHQDSLVGRALDPTRNVADAIGGTCRYDDDVRALLRAAGFRNTLSSRTHAGGFLLEIVANYPGLVSLFVC